LALQTEPVLPQAAKPQLVPSFGKLPLSFEANYGQTDPQVKFIARGRGYTLFLTPTESVMVLQQREVKKLTGEASPIDPMAMPEPAPVKQAVVRMKLEGANPSPAIDGMEQLPGIVNYFIGHDPEKWRTKIPTYARVHYTQAYPGIDLAYYGNQGKLEYDFIVAPGADPGQIKLAFEGASEMSVADSGDLLLTTALGEVRLQKPVVYQLNDDGHKKLVAGQYVVHSESHSETLHASRMTSPVIGVQVAAYDRSRPLIIDPTLVYSTYLGGSSVDIGFGIAVDAAGNAYVTGATSSADFPTTPGAVDTTLDGAEDAYVTKLNAVGSALLYSTYLGGSSLDEGFGIAVDAAGNAYVTGQTYEAPDFPTTPGAVDTTFGGNIDAFVTKIGEEPADLSVTKNGPPDPVAVGQNLTYTIAVVNNGPAATEVTLTDPLPPTAVFLSASAGCAYTQGTHIVTCTLGTMASGASTTIMIVVSPIQGGTISNTATVMGSVTDPNTADNTSTAMTEIHGPPQSPFTCDRVPPQAPRPPVCP
jgi:uncharacterized repeat protein (TIGR01451 family)